MFLDLQCLVFCLADFVLFLWESVTLRYGHRVRGMAACSYFLQLHSFFCRFGSAYHNSQVRVRKTT